MSVDIGEGEGGDEKGGTWVQGPGFGRIAPVSMVQGQEKGGEKDRKALACPW